jgi:predicted TIM-barrel fold metal-dependent hydrolase
MGDVVGQEAYRVSSIGPIVDAHQHFWDPIANDHPWLRPDVVIPFRYGDYSAIKRRYLPADYLADAVGHRISETVYVETEWNPATPAPQPVSGLQRISACPKSISSEPAT